MSKKGKKDNKKNNKKKISLNEKKFNEYLSINFDDKVDSNGDLIIPENKYKEAKQSKSERLQKIKSKTLYEKNLKIIEEIKNEEEEKRKASEKNKKLLEEDKKSNKKQIGKEEIKIDEIDLTEESLKELKKKGDAKSKEERKEHEKIIFEKEKILDKARLKIANRKFKYYKGEKKFSFINTGKAFLILLLIFCIFYIIFIIRKSLNDQDMFHSVSLKPYNILSEKEQVLRNAYNNIDIIERENLDLSPTNLNLSKVYLDVLDDEDRRDLKNERKTPVPVLSEAFDDENVEEEKKSSAFKIYEKLQKKYQILSNALYNLCDLNPVTIVRQYGYSGFSIIGKYNPENKSHVKGKRATYFIPNFNNVIIRYFDGDGNLLKDDNNIKDIMSIASVYTYYHDPYDTSAFLKQCYEMFDNSYTYVASISEVYYCSGCMKYESEENTFTNKDVTLDKIAKIHTEQKVLPKDTPYKAGTLKKYDEDSFIVATNSNLTYDEYVDNIFEGNKVSENNYCPGHVDLNIDVTILTIDASKSLFSVDKNYGMKGTNYNKDWHGWDKLMISRARELSYKDWDKEYGLSVSYIQFVKPLTQEEINYYLSKLDKNITKNRRTVIETALRSVGRIPYYYGGKAFRAGYENNLFGSKVASDYKGRCLKGLDCSGWVNWVYQTAFNKQIIKSDGTSKLAFEGKRIKRNELLPGDLIIRPGIDSHVMMFLEWAEDGKVRVIHENGSVNNVSIASFDAYYPYYRRIIES